MKSATDNATEVTLIISSNMIGSSNDEANFANNLLASIRLSKTQLSESMLSGGFLSRLLGPLLKTVLPLMKNVVKPLVKNVLIPVGLTAAASAANACIQKKILG